ncbi:hypothetical protein E8E13_003196 [Curvularia kusanoi]|uniref:DUF8004 domain-containing protein n=1 Tax=Curvularia kusanoi TaxID=90978 RepID=A0A9P4TC37_CURKU|nr:hypothetical protein E8E13_003196 [Curvularia kusanoi]
MSLSSSLTLPSREVGVVNLFIPAPEYASRQDSFRWHITTRNFFAFLLGKPLVGYHMGQCFVDLQERIQFFRSGHGDNHQDFLQYAEDQGYRDFAECTDYALASLFYAEAYKLRDAWIDAFAHCVGMNESLSLSPEYTTTSKLTKALITRAYLDVDLHLGQVTVALSKFLEEDLSPAYLGLTPGARSHLNRFRRFLHTFYVKKFGYWPPPRGSAFPKALYKSMYYDFQNLYNYLVDADSTTDFAMQGPASGGLCVLQNVDSFDQRHKFTPQPHPLPLIPSYAEQSKKMESQKALRQLTLASQHNKVNGVQTISAALAAATNSHDSAVTNSSIVREYAHFERTYSATLNQRDEKVSVVDARKTRWLLIYGTLQYLVSALRAPKEVRDVDTADYPLCCLLPEQSSWPGSSRASTPAIASPAISAINVPQAIDEYLNSSESDFSSIRPDCQREDYFSTRTASQRGSVDVPAPLKLSTSTPSRTFGSISLSGRNSRRNSVALKPNAHCEIIVHGYGNGLNEATTSSPIHNVSRNTSVKDSHRSSSVSILPEGAGPETSWIRPHTPPVPPERSSSLNRAPRPVHTRQRTPTLDAAELARYYFFAMSTDNVDTEMSRSDSTSSQHSQAWSESSVYSSSSSAYEEHTERHSKTVEDSGLLGGLVSVESTPVPTPRNGSQPAPAAISHMQAFRFEEEDDVADAQFRAYSVPQAVSYEHIHPAFRPPHADIGVALSDTSSALPSPTISMTNRSSYMDSAPAPTIARKPSFSPQSATPSRPSTSTIGLNYNDITVTKLSYPEPSPAAKAPKRSSSFRLPMSTAPSVCAEAKEAEKRAKAERTKNRMSVLKRFYAF